MILVDSRIGSVELLPYISRLNVPVEKTNLEFGDFCFEGNGPKGRITIGVERKTLHDMLKCIDDARYVQQKIGMAEMYDKSFLVVEGCWRPKEDGTLLEGFRGGAVWGECKYRSQRVAYSKLRRYLFSVSLSGVVVLYSRDILQTATDICEVYHYFSKRWENHTSLLEIHKLAIPEMTGRPSLCRRWANDITDIGVKYSMEAEKLFDRTAIKLARSSEVDWLKIKGIGVQTAQRVVREIWGKG